MRNHSYENEFHLHPHFHANQSHFHLNGFARRLVLKQRQWVTRKWPIETINNTFSLLLKDKNSLHTAAHPNAAIKQSFPTLYQHLSRKNSICLKFISVPRNKISLKEDEHLFKISPVLLQTGPIQSIPVYASVLYGLTKQGFAVK